MPIGPTEIVIVVVIILAIFGAGRLPEVGKGLGRSVREFRESTRETSAHAPLADDRAVE